MVLAYKAEYEQNPTISIEELLVKYSITKEDIKGYETWEKGAKLDIVTVVPGFKKPRKVKTIDKVLASIGNTTSNIANLDILVPPLVIEDQPATEVQLTKIANFKELALDHCLKFMSKDAQFSEVKEFKDIVAIVDSLEKSYQKADPESGKPTINIMINNLMERFSDDC